MHYTVILDYNQHSGYSGNGGQTLASARAHLAAMVAYYTDLGYPINQTSIATYCPECTHGKVRRCRAPKRHANGYHGPDCYKTCTTCKGAYETLHPH